jgi:hypothetical protein
MNITVKITGTAPMLMHAAELSDPLSSRTKELKKITGKPSRQWVDEDHVAKYRLQFECALYFDPQVGPYLPGVNIAKCLRTGAGLFKRGDGVKVERGLLLVSPINPLTYSGPRDISGLWNDARFRFTVPVNGNPSSAKKSRVMACRPIFREWEATATCLINPAVLSVDDLRSAAETAGSAVGLGDWRPYHGRFTTTVSVA